MNYIQQKKEGMVYTDGYYLHPILIQTVGPQVHLFCKVGT
jgi:hypothetical protein